MIFTAWNLEQWATSLLRRIESFAAPFERYAKAASTDDSWPILATRVAAGLSVICCWRVLGTLVLVGTWLILFAERCCLYVARALLEAAVGAVLVCRWFLQYLRGEI